MTVIRVTRTIPASPERAFAALTDHASFSALPGLNATLITEGDPSPNGLGAVRRMGGAGVWFDEEVVAWDPPRSYSYRITAGTFAIEHDGGTVTIRPSGSGCDVEWKTAITYPPGLKGRAMAALVTPIVRVSLERLLAFAAKRASDASSGR